MKASIATLRPGRWISLFPILAVIPRLGLMVLASDRQQVANETRVALLWLSSGALAVLVGLAEVYIGVAVVSRRHRGLAALWVGITVLLNTLIVPLSVSGLEAVPVWEILATRGLQVAWGAGLGLLSTLCVCGCLWADIVREGEGLAELYEQHLLGRIAAEEDRGAGLETQLAAEAGRTAELETQVATESARAAELEEQVRAEGGRAAKLEAKLAAIELGRKHAACEICGFWDASQRKTAGHIFACRLKEKQKRATAAGEPKPS